MWLVKEWIYNGKSYGDTPLLITTHLYRVMTYNCVANYIALALPDLFGPSSARASVIGWSFNVGPGRALSDTT